MLQEFISSKIHRATVTDANLNYVGSITIDETLMKESKIKEWQKVDILDINKSERHIRGGMATRQKYLLLHRVN